MPSRGGKAALQMKTHDSATVHVLWIMATAKRRLAPVQDCLRRGKKKKKTTWRRRNPYENGKVCECGALWKSHVWPTFTKQWQSNRIKAESEIQYDPAAHLYTRASSAVRKKKWGRVTRGRMTRALPCWRRRGRRPGPAGIRSCMWRWWPPSSSSWSSSWLTQTPNPGLHHANTTVSSYLVVDLVLFLEPTLATTDRLVFHTSTWFKLKPRRCRWDLIVLSESLCDLRQVLSDLLLSQQLLSAGSRLQWRSRLISTKSQKGHTGALKPGSRNRERWDLDSKPLNCTSSARWLQKNHNLINYRYFNYLIKLITF